MKILFENEIVKVEVHERNSIFKQTWYSQSANMTDEYYRELALIVVDELRKLDIAKYHLVNTSNFIFPIIPETQKWLANILFPTIAERKGEKMAVIISSDIFAQVSIEQIERENKDAIIKIKYFDNEENALNWFVE